MDTFKLSRRSFLGGFAASATIAQLGLGHAGELSAIPQRAAKLFYTDAGHGRNIMLLHGWTADSHDWSWQIPILEKRYRTVAVDLRGHGRSEVMPTGQYLPEHYSFDIISLIQTKFPGQRFSLIGHSMGGQIAARIAAMRPDLVDSVVSVDGSLGFSEQFIPIFQKTTTALQTTNPAKVALSMMEGFYDPVTSLSLKTWHARRMMGMPLAPFIESFGPLFIGAKQVGVGAASEALLRSINVPLYHLCRFKGQADQMRGWFKHPKSKVEVWEHAGHWIMQDRPDDVNASLLAWLDED